MFAGLWVDGPDEPEDLAINIVNRGIDAYAEEVALGSPSTAGDGRGPQLGLELSRGRIRGLTGVAVMSHAAAATAFRLQFWTQLGKARPVHGPRFWGSEAPWPLGEIGGS